MKSFIIFSVAFFLLSFQGIIFANSSPAVSNVTVSQRADASKLVDIYYNLSDADGDGCIITLEISNDSGNTWTIPTTTAQGNIGTGVTPKSGLHIIWDPKIDTPGQTGCTFKVRITADDMAGPDITWVYIDNDPGVDGHEGFTGYMSKYEITNDQYCMFLNQALASGDICVDKGVVYGSNGSNGGADFVGQMYFYTSTADSTFNGNSFSVRSRDGYYMGNHPVVYVSWYGATAFCNYYGYRLPTEWEWQAVADYNGSYTYGCGTTISFAKANYYNDGYANPLNLSSEPYTSPVNYYPSYGYGMNDMAGNVWEWTSSIVYSTFALRGGCWNEDNHQCEVICRICSAPCGRGECVGFRVCRDTEPNITWVYIDDDGSGMKDEYGNPISHGGFTGYMSKYETTNDQYSMFLNAALATGDITIDSNGIVYGASGSNSGADFVGQRYFLTCEALFYSQITYSGSVFSVRSPYGYYRGNHPVLLVSGYGATAFCNYYGWRLPTEWEWQAVADFDGSYSYGCGTTIDHSKANYDLDNPLNLSSWSYTSPVNHYPSYGYGMNDMAGNVWEWTSSLLDPYNSSYRIFRGGCWWDGDYYLPFPCTVSSRNYCLPYEFNTGLDIGFRVCR